MKLHWTDVEELARVMLNLPEDSDSDTIENTLCDKYEISFEAFQQIAEALMPLTLTAKAAISGEEFHGFVKDGAFIVKAPVRPNVEVTGAARLYRAASSDRRERGRLPG